MAAPFALNTNPAPAGHHEAKPRSLRPQRAGRWILYASLACSLGAPIVACGFVMHQHVGFENLQRHYWLLDAAILSVILNAVLLSPLLSRKLRSMAATYVPVATVVILMLAYFIYDYWMVALTGV